VREIEELSSIFNQVISLARIMLGAKGYVFSVNLDLLERGLTFKVLNKKAGENPAKPAVFTTSVRPVGKSPYATTIPVEVAEALKLKPGDKVSWFPMNGGVYISKAAEK